MSSSFSRLFALVCLVSGTAHAATLSIGVNPLNSGYPATPTINVNDSVVVDIVGNYSGGDSFDGGGLIVSWDPNIIDYGSFTLYNWANTDPSLRGAWGLYGGSLDATAGKLTVAFGDDAAFTCSALNPAPCPYTPVLGDFSIMRLTFNALADGTSPLTLAVDLPNQPMYHTEGGVGALEITPTLSDGSITVGVVPLPAALWLMLSSVAMLGVIGRRQARASFARE